MNRNKTKAFGSLEDRVISESSRFDRITLRDHVVTVEIGAFQVERDITQRVAFDIVVEVIPPNEPLADDVDRILSYDFLVESVEIELAAERFNLLETLAERIAGRILGAQQATRVFLRIQKLDLGPGNLGIEIVRSRNSSVSLKRSENLESTSKHILVYLTCAAVNSKLLPSWLDQLQGLDKPIIICLEPFETDYYTVRTPLVKKRIELLAIEQNAWVLAGLDRRCIVVDSHAEIKWAAQKNLLAVWAPSKIVMDSFSDPVAPVGDPVALAKWFAKVLAAEQLIFVNTPASSVDKIPVTLVALNQAFF